MVPEKALRADRGRRYITKLVMFKVGLVSRRELWGWLVAGGTGRRELLVSKGWIQAVALTFVVGFFLLGLIGYKTYSGQPPTPEKGADPAAHDGVSGGAPRRAAEGPRGAGRRSRRRSWIRRRTSCSPGRTSGTARRSS